MGKWNYGGEVFELPDNLSAEQATDQIEAILEDRRISEKVSGPSEEDSVDKKAAPSTPADDDESFLGDVFGGILSGATRIAQGPLELAALYTDLKYVNDPVLQSAMREKVKDGEAVPASSNLPISCSVRPKLL